MIWLYVLLVGVVGSWLVFTIWTLRRPAPRFLRPILAFECQSTDDEQITCFFCCRPFVDLEFAYRTHDRMVVAGIHQECLDNLRHLALTAPKLRELVG